MFIEITKKEFKKAVKKAFKKGQLDMLERSMPYLEKGFYKKTVGLLTKKKKDKPIKKQFLERK